MRNVVYCSMKYCLNLCCLKPVEDSYRHVHRTVSEQSENSEDTDTGGINIDEAKRRLQQADSIDKKLHRDRVQQKHRVCICDTYVHCFDILPRLVS